MCAYFIKIKGVLILSVNIFKCDRRPLADQLLPFAFFFVSALISGYSQKTDYFWEYIF